MHSLNRLWQHRNRLKEVFDAFLKFHARSALTLIPAYLRFSRLSYPVTLKTATGYEIQVHSLAEMEVVWHVFVRECYDIPANAEVIVDAGGNIGIFAIFAASKAPKSRVYSLEPFPDTYRALCLNIERNGLGNRIQAICLGLSDASKQVEMSGEPASTDRRLSDDAVTSKGSVESVSVSSLKDFIAAQGLTVVDFLKMDIEGSEWDVVLTTESDVFRRIRRVQLEYHPMDTKRGLKPEMLIERLRQGGHTIVGHAEDAFGTGLLTSALDA